jgi:hypothetical protein
MIDPLSYRMGELSGWFYQLSTGGINKMSWASKFWETDVISFILSKLKEHCLTAERQGSEERICPFVGG